MKTEEEEMVIGMKEVVDEPRRVERRENVDEEMVRVDVAAATIGCDEPEPETRN